MQLPTIHLNGTSAKSLAESYGAASHALRNALDCLEAVELNGRDYYPQGPIAFKVAASEHLQRCKDLKTVLDEVSMIEAHCLEAIERKL